MAGWWFFLAKSICLAEASILYILRRLPVFSFQQEHYPNYLLAHLTIIFFNTNYVANGFPSLNQLQEDRELIRICYVAWRAWKEGWGELGWALTKSCCSRPCTCGLLRALVVGYSSAACDFGEDPALLWPFMYAACHRSYVKWWLMGLGATLCLSWYFWLLALVI